MELAKKFIERSIAKGLYVKVGQGTAVSFDFGACPGGRVVESLAYTEGMNEYAMMALCSQMGASWRPL